MTAMTVTAAFAACVLFGAAMGWGTAWWLHRRTAVSPRVLYAGGLLGPIALIAALWTREPLLVLPAVVVAIGGMLAAVLGRRWRLAALGAGGEMREFEQARTSALGALRARRALTGGEVKTFIAGQGELVRQRGWPSGEPFVPMTAGDGGRLPRGAGRHVLIAGATGSGKTVSARRWLLARILADGVAALVLDPKGDPELEVDLRKAARLASRPFVLFDPRDPDTDRWNPLWSPDTGAVVSRVVAPIGSGEGNARYYADLLQIHLGLIAEALRAIGLWPANLPLLLDAAQLHSYDQLRALVDERTQDRQLNQRLREHRQLITDPTGRRDLLGGTTRLRVIAGETWRTALTPHPDRGAITLPTALEAGAVVLVRTWVDDLPEEAKAITTLFLADAAASALATPQGTEWAALLDEFGAVLSAGAGERALALMQRARSAGGQVAISTQSVIDFAAATENPALLDALADNFSAGVFHRQSSPESRDWLARLIGTREVWQYTDRTSGGGAFAEGSGTRRRVREFLIRPDEFRTLHTGQAVIWTTLGPHPERITVTPAALPDTAPNTVSPHRLYQPFGPAQLPATDPHEQPARTRISHGQTPAVPDQVDV